MHDVIGLCVHICLAVIRESFMFVYILIDDPEGYIRKYNFSIY